VAEFNIETARSPCVKYSCRMHADERNNKNSNACMTCEARWRYVDALAGDPKALRYFAELDPGTLGVDDDCDAIQHTEGTEALDLPVVGKEYRPIKIVKQEKSRLHYENKYYKASAVIAKEIYGIDFKTFGEILKYSYEKEKLQSKMTEIYNLSKGTVKYLFDAYGIKTVGGMKAAMTEKWRIRKNALISPPTIGTAEKV